VTGRCRTEADLLPVHTDHPVGTSAPGYPLLPPTLISRHHHRTTGDHAVLSRCELRQAEALRRDLHTDPLMRPHGVVVLDPLVELGLSKAQVLEDTVGAELRTQTA